MKFDVVLTNPPFGENRKFEPRDENDRAVAELYELWDEARVGNWIDPGLLFLENAYRILGEHGRLGIVLSNSIASIDRWEKARNWLVRKMRIVGLFDLPPNIFAETGVNTTLVVAYKDKEDTIKELTTNGYEVFIKDIANIGYEVRTLNRVKFFSPKYKIDDKTFQIMVDEQSEPLLDEEFTQTINEFREWANSQEEVLKRLFLK
jgi:type I restriction enzyme M protein